MSVVLLFAVALAQIAPRDVFSVRAELQGLYDEISQATLASETAGDVDRFHAVLYTSDWTFVDAVGQRHSWPEMREQAIHMLDGPRFDSIAQRIQKLSLVPGGATVLVNVTMVRTVVDNDGQYGRKGASHTLTETTVFRDGWVQVSDGWKLKSREQIGQPKVLVDKPQSEW